MAGVRLPLGQLIARPQAPVGPRSAQQPRARGAGQPEDQQDNQHQAQQSAAVVWTAPAGASPVVIAAASAEEQNQHDDQENQHDTTHLNKTWRSRRLEATASTTGFCL